MFKVFIKYSVVLAFVVSVVGGTVIGSGMYNIAANDKHWDITTSMIEVMRDKSIETRSKELQAPNLDNKDRIARAAPNYAAMCATCHLSPGVDKSELYEGLYPQPVVFTKVTVPTRQPEETFWIIKNGLKMTGMPAWGLYNSDDQIWDLVAFVNTVNEMSAEEYQKLVDAGEHMHGKGGGHSESKENSDKPKASADHDNTAAHHK